MKKFLVVAFMVTGLSGFAQASEDQIYCDGYADNQTSSMPTATQPQRRAWAMEWVRIYEACLESRRLTDPGE